MGNQPRSINFIFPALFIATAMLLSGVLSSCNLTSLSLDEIACIESVAPWTTQPEMNIYYPWAGMGERAGDFPGTSVTLSWLIPYPCLPDNYRVIINDIPMIGPEPLLDEMVPLDEMGPPSGSSPVVVYEDGTTASGLTWTPDETFKPGYYWWWVIPYYSGYHGISSPAYRINISMSDISGRSTVCNQTGVGSHSMIHPVYPGNGQVIHSLSTELVWRDNNPQAYRCNEIWTHRYLILYSQNYAAIDTLYRTDEYLNAIIDPVPDYIWDFDDGVWFYYGDSWNDNGLIFPPDISAIPVEGEQSVEITLTSCERVYWVAFHLWAKERNSYFTATGGIFKKSEMRSFDIDPALCEETLDSMPYSTTAEFLVPMAFTLGNTNCRSGPSLDYPLMSILPAGNEYEIRARNTSGDSWMVFDPAINNTCWVAGDLVEVLGDTSELEVVIVEQAPPPVTDEPTTVDCSQWSSDQQACIANDACTWQPNLYPESPCRNK